MKVIAVAGKTGAKTSTIVRWMQFYPGVSSVSFGDYLRKENTKEIDLQDFGESFLRTRGPKELLRGVLSMRPEPQGYSLIIDGLRHPEVWQALVDDFPDSTLVCVAPPKDVLIKSLRSSGITKAEAENRINHPVERGLDDLVLRAHYVTRGSTISETEDHAIRSLVAAVDPAIVPEPIQQKIIAGTSSKRSMRERKTELLKAEALSRGRRAVFNLLLAEGGCVSQAEVAERLGTSVRQIDQLRQQGEILAVSVNGKLQFPLWQFVDGRILKGMKPVLAALHGHNELAKLRFFLVENLLLSGQSPLQVLREGRTAEATRAARAYLMHGAA
jgi:hypothetical protein